MNYGQYRKSVVAIAPASVASNATAGLDIDTRGAQPLETLAGHLRIGILHRCNHT